MHGWYGIGFLDVFVPSAAKFLGLWKVDAGYLWIFVVVYWCNISSKIAKLVQSKVDSKY